MARVNSKVILVVVAAVLVIAGVAFWYWQRKAPAPIQEEPAAVEVEDGLGAEAFKKSNNPLSNELPATNPFQVNSNPFK